jgi:hypothetical protein
VESIGVPRRKTSKRDWSQLNRFVFTALVGFTLTTAAVAQVVPPQTSTSTNSVSATSTNTVSQSGQPPVTQTESCHEEQTSTDASGTTQTVTCELTTSTDTAPEFADLTPEDWSLLWQALTGQPQP